MFDIGFSELLLIFIIGLIVLGPQKLPIAIRTVVGWIRTLRGIASNVQNELAQELKLQELQESIKKAEELNVSKLSPELAKTVEDLKVSAEKMHSELHRQEKELKSQLEASKVTTTISPPPSPDRQAEMAEEDESKLEFEQEQMDLSCYDPLADPDLVSPTSDTNSNQTKSEKPIHNQHDRTS